MSRTDTAPVLGHKIRSRHRERLAVVYVRQSTPQQVVDNREWADLQYQLRRRAVALGWADDRDVVIDDDPGISGASVENRPGFQRLLAEVSITVSMSPLSWAGNFPRSRSPVYRPGP